MKTFLARIALILALMSACSCTAYLERTAPWKQAKAGQTGRVATSLYYATEALRLCSVLLHPVMPERTTELWRRLGWPPPELAQELGAEGLAWGTLHPGSPVAVGPPLFPKDVSESNDATA